MGLCVGAAGRCYGGDPGRKPLVISFNRSLRAQPMKVTGIRLGMGNAVHQRQPPSYKDRTQSPGKPPTNGKSLTKLLISSCMTWAFDPVRLFSLTAFQPNRTDPALVSLPAVVWVVEQGATLKSNHSQLQDLSLRGVLSLPDTTRRSRTTSPIFGLPQHEYPNWKTLGSNNPAAPNSPKFVIFIHIL